MIKKYRILKILLIYCLILNITSYSTMAEDITIRDRVVNHDVFGNGDLHTDGDLPVGGASNNSVTIGGTAGVSGGTMGGVVAGAINLQGIIENVVSNTVFIDIRGDGGPGQGVIADNVYGGLASVNGNAINNRLTIQNGTLGTLSDDAHTYGGFSLNGRAQGNVLEMTGGVIVHDAYGGCSNAGIAEGNKLEMTGGTIAQTAIGGSGSDNAIDNRLTIRNGTIGTIGGDGVVSGDGAFGGYSWNGIAQGNVLEMTGGTINIGAYGGYGYGDNGNSGNAISNTLKILSGNVIGGAYGGYSQNGIVQRNVLEMAGGTITGTAYGGHGQGDAIDNRLTIRNGTIGSGGIGAVGGHSGNGIAQGNVLEMERGTTVTGHAFGGFSVNGRAERNVLEMAGEMITGDACGGYGREVINNTLKISRGNIKGAAYGGKSSGEIAQGNILEMTGGTIGKGVCGGYSDTSAAISNRVNISGGSIKGNVIGGGSLLEARDNKVIISGGEFLGDVYGGRSVNGGAVGNTIEISGDPKFSTNTYIYGGYSGTAGKDTFTNNTLNIKTDNITVKGIGNFQFINFFNPIKNGNAMLTCAQQVNIKDGIITAEMNKDEDVGVNDKYILIRGIGGFDGVIYKEVKIKQGVLAKYKAALFINNNTDLGIVITDEYINTRSEILTQGKAVNTEVVNKGLDFIVDRGIRLAKDTSIVSNGVVPFATFKGGKSNLSYTGSNINMDEIAVLGGVAKEFNMEGTKAVLGAFIQDGRANYSLAKEIEGVDVKAVGSTNYVGFGVLATVDMVNDSYLEGSFGLGKYDVDYNTDDLDLEKKRNTSDYSSVYLGGHVGVGHVYKLNKKTNIDVSAKFLFMYQAEKDLKLSSGDNLKYGSVKSGRVRIGAKADYGLSKRRLRNIRPYAGINYEHEFMVQIEAVTIDIDLPRVDLKYGVWLGELGVRKDIGNFNIDCSVIKYVGREDGIDAMVRVRYCFDKENMALTRLIRKALKRSKYSSMVKW